MKVAANSTPTTTTTTTPKLEPELIKAKKRPPAPNVRHAVHPWGEFYEGTRDDLIKARICQPGWFVDGTERDKSGRIVRQRCVSHQGRSIKVMQQQNGKFLVRIHFTPEEKARKAQPEKVKLAVAVDRERSNISRLHGTSDSFRNSLLHVLGAACDMVKMHFANSGGYRLDPCVEDDVNGLLADAYWTARRADIGFSGPLRARQIRNIRLDTARANAPLQRLLQGSVLAIDNGTPIEGAQS